jgi:hypothetical protein
MVEGIDQLSVLGIYPDSAVPGNIQEHDFVGFSRVLHVQGSKVVRIRNNADAGKTLLKSDIGVIRRDFYSFLAHGVIEMLATN